MIRFLRTEKGCVFGDRSSMGVVRCPTSRFASVVPAAAAPSAASIALCSMAATELSRLCYVMCSGVALAPPKFKRSAGERTGKDAK